MRHAAPLTVPAPPAQRGTSREGPNAYDDLLPDLRRLAAMATDDPARGPLRDRLICAILPLVRNLSARFRTSNHSTEDIERAGALGLIKAIDRYDPDAGATSSCGRSTGAAPTAVTGTVRRAWRTAASICPAVCGRAR